MKRNRGPILALAIALLLVWALDEIDEWRTTQSMCQSDVLPDHGDATYALAFRDATLGNACRAPVSLDEKNPWGSMPLGPYVARLVDSYLFPSK